MSEIQYFLNYKIDYLISNMLRSKLIVFAILLMIQVCQVQSLGSLRSKANPNKLRNRSVWNRKSLKDV